jgi:hypothetical protein
MSVHNIHLKPGESCQINVTTDGATVPPDPGPGPDPGPVDPPPSGTKVIDLPWDSHGQRTYTADHGGFGANEVIAFKFTTGPNPTDGRGAVNVSSSLYPGHGGSPGSRRAVISPNPGDFDNVVSTNMARCESVGNESVTITFDVAPYSRPFTPILQPSTTYYFNLRYENGADGGNVQAYIAKPGYLP